MELSKKDKVQLVVTAVIVILLALSFFGVKWATKIVAVAVLVLVAVFWTKKLSSKKEE